MATSVKIDEELERRVRRVAEQKRRSAQGVMHEAIEQYVVREEARQAFLEEADASWREFQQTGRHLTFDELAVWLETWGTDAEKAPPECHD